MYDTATLNLGGSVSECFLATRRTLANNEQPLPVVNCNVSHSRLTLSHAHGFSTHFAYRRFGLVHPSLRDELGTVCETTPRVPDRRSLDAPRGDMCGTCARSRVSE